MPVVDSASGKMRSPLSVYVSLVLAPSSCLSGPTLYSSHEPGVGRSLLRSSEPAEASRVLQDGFGSQGICARQLCAAGVDAHCVRNRCNLRRAHCARNSTSAPTSSWLDLRRRGPVELVRGPRRRMIRNERRRLSSTLGRVAVSAPSLTSRVWTSENHHCHRLIPSS